MLDNMVNDIRMEMDMSMESKTSSRSAVSKVSELQVCVCGWSKAKMVRGLKVHHGKMKCSLRRDKGLALISTSNKVSQVSRMKSSDRKQTTACRISLS